MPVWSAASWQGPPDSNFGGPAIECRGLVEHIAEGSYQGTIGWQKNPISDVSSHFVIGLNGEIAQMLDTNTAAWTQGAGNGHWVSAEFAGFSTGSYTPQQQEVASQLYAWLVQVHGVPLQLADSPSGHGWGWHGMGGVAWGNHPNCPGPTNVALRTPMLARTIQILDDGGGSSDMPMLIRVNQTGLIAIGNGPIWYRLSSPAAVEAAKRIWGITGNPLAIDQADLAAFGVDVATLVNSGGGGGLVAHTHAVPGVATGGAIQG